MTRGRVTTSMAAVTAVVASLMWFGWFGLSAQALTLKLGTYNQETALHMIQLSALSYCPPEKIKEWKCSSCETSYSGIQVVENQYQHNIIMNNGKDTIMVISEGTPPDKMDAWKKTLEDQLADKSDFCMDCKIHSGYNDILGLVDSKLLSALNDARNVLPNANVVFAGHGVGGALASLLAFEYVKNGAVPSDLVTVYTFGSPLVGNKEWAKAYSNLLPNTWRVNSNEDLTVVPSPSAKMSNYASVGKTVTCLNRNSPDCPFDADKAHEELHMSNSEHKVYLGVDVSRYSDHNSPNCASRFPELTSHTVSAAAALDTR